MLSKVHAAALRGVEAVPVEVEVSVGPGEQKVVVVGLPDAAVRESAGGAKDTRANHSGGRVRAVPPVEVDKYGYNRLDPARVLMPNVRNKITLPFSGWLVLRKILS